MMSLVLSVEEAYYYYYYYYYYCVSNHYSSNTATQYIHSYASTSTYTYIFRLTDIQYYIYDPYVVSVYVPVFTTQFYK